jgi:hypothetical protein
VRIESPDARHETVNLLALGRLEESLVVVGQAETAAEEAADRIAIGWALFARGRATGIATEDSAAVLAMAEQGLAVIGDDLGATEIRFLLCGLQLTALWNLSRPEEAARAMGKALTMAERAGSPVSGRTHRRARGEPLSRPHQLRRRAPRGRVRWL